MTPDEKIKGLQDAVVEEQLKAVLLLEKLKLVANDPRWEEKGMPLAYDEYEKQARLNAIAMYPELMA